MRRSKKYTQSVEAYDRSKLYSVEEAIKCLKAFPARNFDETVELSMNLGIDGRQADQALRGTVMLPHGTGQEIRVLVITQGALIEAAQEAGADRVDSPGPSAPRLDRRAQEAAGRGQPARIRGCAQRGRGAAGRIVGRDLREL